MTFMIDENENKFHLENNPFWNWIIDITTYEQNSDLGHMNRSTVAVVQTESMKYLHWHLRVFAHMIPKERTVFWLLAITQLDVVTPGNQFSSKIDHGRGFSEVAQRIIVHHPAIIGHRVASFLPIHQRLFAGQIWIWLEKREISEQM